MQSRAAKKKWVSAFWFRSKGPDLDLNFRAGFTMIRKLKIFFADLRGMQK